MRRGVVSLLGFEPSIVSRRSPRADAHIPGRVYSSGRPLDASRPGPTPLMCRFSFKFRPTVNRAPFWQPLFTVRLTDDAFGSVPGPRRRAGSLRRRSSPGGGDFLNAFNGRWHGAETVLDGPSNVDRMSTRRSKLNCLIRRRRPFLAPWHGQTMRPRRAPILRPHRLVSFGFHPTPCRLVPDHPVTPDPCVPSQRSRRERAGRLRRRLPPPSPSPQRPFACRERTG